MKKVEVEGVQISYYTSEKEWIEEFYGDLPEGYLIDAKSLPNSTGFASLNPEEIFILRTSRSEFEDLLSTVAHELGHIVSGGYETNPPDNEEFADEHEKKAEHYENFVMKAYKITNALSKMDADWDTIRTYTARRPEIWSASALFPMAAYEMGNGFYLYERPDKSYNIAERKDLSTKDVIWHDYAIRTVKELEVVLEELKNKSVSND